jgi:hypothetical protein
MLKEIIFLLSGAKIFCASSSSSSLQAHRETVYVERFDRFDTYTMASGAGGPPSPRDYLPRDVRGVRPIFPNLNEIAIPYDNLHVLHFRDIEGVRERIDYFKVRLLQAVATLEIYPETSSSPEVHTLQEFCMNREILEKWMLNEKIGVTFHLSLSGPDTTFLTPRVWLYNIALRICNGYESVVLPAKGVSGEDRFYKIIFSKGIIVQISKDTYDPESNQQFNVDEYKTSLEDFRKRLEDFRKRLKMQKYLTIPPILLPIVPTISPILLPIVPTISPILLPIVPNLEGLIVPILKPNPNTEELSTQIEQYTLRSSSAES